MSSDFWKVKCKKCGAEMIIFSHASRDIKCKECGTLIAQSTGGKLHLLEVDILETYD
ncbi:MAG: 30S ribosomal protein S27e [Candidatus Micrarchaeota archaeon]|nr:30S ribosomal protein S27e [Candidatus Micrarchaeota archaeon]